MDSSRRFAGMPVACACVVRAPVPMRAMHACKCSAGQGRRRRHRPAVRRRGAPEETREDGAPVVDRRITRQELKKPLATPSWPCDASTVNDRRTTVCGSRQHAALMLTVLADPSPLVSPPKPFKSLVQESEKAGRHSALPKSYLICTGS